MNKLCDALKKESWLVIADMRQNYLPALIGLYDKPACPKIDLVQSFLGLW